MNPVKSFSTLMLEDAVNHPFGDKLENPIGTSHNFPWPKINGALSAKSSKFMRKAITDNQKWFVSGKIDGCNVSVSSKGWVASRNQIIEHLKQCHVREFGQRKTLKTTTEKLRPLFDKIYDLNRKYLVNLGMDLTQEDEMILYGEFVLPGTSSSPHDVYNNKLNGFKVGQLYVFGMGFVFKDQEDTEKQMLQLRKHFDNVQLYDSADGKKDYFIVPINQKQKPWFRDIGIDTVDFYPADTFVNIFTKKNKGNFISKLESRLLEGYVLHDSTSQMMKWKYQFERSDYHDALVEAFKKEWIENDDQVKVIQSLEHLYKYSDNIVTAIEQDHLEEFLNDFMLANMESTLEKRCQEMWDKKLLNSAEKTFMFDCWLQHAQTSILFLLLPSDKWFFDPKIKCDIVDYISKHLLAYMDEFFEERSKTQCFYDAAL